MDEAYFIEQFKEHEQKSAWDDLFFKISQEAEDAARSANLSFDTANIFVERNRYRNVLPYDQHLVTLKEDDGEGGGGYINASPLQAPFSRHQYILTQGPLSNTSDHFWQMVEENGCRIVVALSKVTEKNFIKCHPYFPTKEDPTVAFGPFQCLLLKEEPNEHYILRELELKKGSGGGGGGSDGSNNNAVEGPRTIHHFQFVKWPDFGVPEHTDHFLEFLEHIRRLDRDLNKGVDASSAPPIVCHCSAGIGRTGTYVLVDSVLSMLESKRSTSKHTTDPKKDDEPQLKTLNALVVHMRLRRMGLIQTPQQLRFCWKAIVDWIGKQGEEPVGGVALTTAVAENNGEEVEAPKTSPAPITKPTPTATPIAKAHRKRSSNEWEVSAPPSTFQPSNSAEQKRKELEGRRQKVEEMRARLAATEHRLRAGWMGRLAVRGQNNAAQLKRLALWGGGAAAGLAAFAIAYAYFSTLPTTPNGGRVDL